MRTSTLATTGLVLLTAGAALLTLNNYQKAGQPKPATQDERVPRYVLHDAQWTRLDKSGQPEYRAQAQTLEYYDDESSRLTLPVIHAFGGKTSPWKLTAREGSTPPHSRDLLLQPNVLITGHWQDGRELSISTPKLWLDTGHKLLHTDEPVELISVGRKLDAKGLVADSAGEQIKLLANVHGVYEPDS